MKEFFFLGLFALLIIGDAQSQRAEINRVKKIDADFGDCSFILKDRHNGSLTVTQRGTPQLANYYAMLGLNSKHPFQTRIVFGCDPSTPETYVSVGVRMTRNGWSLAHRVESPTWATHATIYLLHGKSWVGAGTTQDQTNGDEDRRMRTFSFCIPHGERALCGDVSATAYLNDPKSSVLPQVIQLLESIEFIDPPASSTPQTNSLSTQ